MTYERVAAWKKFSQFFFCVACTKKLLSKEIIDLVKSSVINLFDSGSGGGGSGDDGGKRQFFDNKYYLNLTECNEKVYYVFDILAPSKSYAALNANTNKSVWH